MFFCGKCTGYGNIRLASQTHQEIPINIDACHGSCLHGRYCVLKSHLVLYPGSENTYILGKNLLYYETKVKSDDIHREISEKHSTVP